MRKDSKVQSIDSGNHRSRVQTRRDKLIKDHLELVEAIAKRIEIKYRPLFQLQDLIGAGNLGLVRAATMYRPKKHGNCPFSAYARYRIRGAILDSIRRRNMVEALRPSIDDVDLVCRTDSPRTINAALRVFTEPEKELDRELLLSRLQVALTRLTDEQRALLDTYYAEETDRLKRAHFRRRREVSENHHAILQILRRELSLMIISREPGA